MIGSSGSSAGSLVSASQSGLVFQSVTFSAWRDGDKIPGMVMPPAVTNPEYWKKPRRVILLITKVIYINNLFYLNPLNLKMIVCRFKENRDKKKKI